jgi:hypothetical protein
MSYLVNPWLFWAGIFAVALPVLIHLLNRRRVRIVEWAAMDFLLQADRQSRQRIRLQYWLLLFLRSLAVALVGLMLARPLVPTGLPAALAPAAQCERVIVLDDSLSMQAQAENESAWEAAKRSANDLIQRLAIRHKGKDTCTLLVTSRPDQPIMSSAALTVPRADEGKLQLDELSCSDAAGDLPGCFRALAQGFASQPAGRNRIIYVFTDMRRPDWQLAAKPVQAASAAPVQTIDSLRQLSEHTQGCFLIDAGGREDGNLTVAKVEAEGPLVSDVRAALDVTVLNQSSAVAGNVGVRLHVENGLPAVETIKQLAPGEAATVRFYSTFGCETRTGAAQQSVPHIQPRPLRVELKSDKPVQDLLAGDSTYYFPARVSCGFRTLLVDGDPSAELSKSESYFLRRALAPAGPAKSGVVPRVMTENDLDSVSFADYDVVFLLNCGQLGTKTAENLHRLTQWVAQGGSLVLMPGDQIDAGQFNNQFWQNGKGLSPIKLLSITRESDATGWMKIQFLEDNRLLARLTAEQDALLGSAKFFRYWQASVPEKPVAENAVRIIASFADSDRSPAIVQQTHGNGRVVACTFPADADWHNWPSNPSYVLMVQDLVHALVKDETSQSLLRVGGAIQQPLDLAQFEIDAVLEDPKRTKSHLHASRRINDSDSTIWQLTQPTAGLIGFYNLTLSRRSGGDEELLFAANADADEGDLKRADLQAIKNELAGTNVHLISNEDLATLTESGGRTELWRYLLWFLIAVLASEQALGWLFGRDRT